MSLACTVDSVWTNRGEFLSGGDTIVAFLTGKWEKGLFDETGLMARRIASINDRPIAWRERLFPWPLGRRPDDHLTMEMSSHVSPATIRHAGLMDSS